MWNEGHGEILENGLRAEFDVPGLTIGLGEKDELAHFIRALVLEQLDLREILSQYEEERGYPPFHPAMMTAVLLYGYCQGSIRHDERHEPADSG